MEQYLTLQMFNLNPLLLHCVQLENLDFSITKSRSPNNSTKFILLTRPPLTGDAIVTNLNEQESTTRAFPYSATA